MTYLIWIKDAPFSLERGTYSPYNKPNNTPTYVHKQSNHPPLILKNIPEGVNKRLSTNSSNQEIFEQAAPLFQAALDKSGYSFKLHFNPPKKPKNKRKKNRTRNILWFNPPFHLAVKTNVGKEFLNLLINASNRTTLYQKS